MEPNNAKKMILNLSSGEAVRPVSPGKSSPIPQMDGVEDMDNDTVTYTFQSEYAEEDIIETLDEIFSDKKAAETTALVSRVRIEPSSNVHECAVEIKVATANKSFCWPELKGINAKVIKEIKKIKKQ